MSGRKNILPAYKLLTAQSLAAAFQSGIITINTATHLIFTVETAACTANTGTFGVQFRVYQDLNNYGAWIDLTLTSVPTLADANLNAMMDLRLPPGQVRITFTPGGVGPNGTVACWVTGNSEG